MFLASGMLGSFWLAVSLIYRKVPFLFLGELWQSMRIFLRLRFLYGDHRNTGFSLLSFGVIMEVVLMPLLSLRQVRVWLFFLPQHACNFYEHGFDLYGGHGHRQE